MKNNKNFSNDNFKKLLHHGRYSGRCITGLLRRDCNVGLRRMLVGLATGFFLFGVLCHGAIASNCVASLLPTDGKMIMLFATNDDASVQKLAAYLQDLNKTHEGKQVMHRITILKNRAIRSNDQNARYWAMLTAIAVVTGYTKEELHEYYKKKFLCKWVLDEFVPQSTTVLDTMEMVAYTNKVEEHAKDFHGVKFVNPNDINYVAWLEEVDQNYNKMFASI